MRPSGQLQYTGLPHRGCKNQFNGIKYLMNPVLPFLAHCSLKTSKPYNKCVTSLPTLTHTCPSMLPKSLVLHNWSRFSVRRPLLPLADAHPACPNSATHINAHLSLAACWHGLTTTATVSGQTVKIYRGDGGGCALLSAVRAASLKGSRAGNKLRTTQHQQVKHTRQVYSPQVRASSGL